MLNMKAKKQGPSEDSSNQGVDMERIKELMGPLPNELSEQESSKTKTELNKKSVEPTLEAEPETAPVVNEKLAEAAEEANASLKAMAPDLGEATITKVDDEEEPLPNAEDSTDSETSEPTEEGVASDDPLVVKAVNDIVAHEGDQVLEAEDEKKSSLLEETGGLGIKDKIKDFFRKKWVRRGLLGVALTAILGVALFPTSRYFVLNTVGVRASLNVNVVDSGTLQPLKNVQVSAAGVTAQTDGKGVARLEHVKLGPTELKISKRAFTSVTQQVTVGWGSNPKGQFRLAASGAQYTFMIKDFLSSKAVISAEVSSGEGSAVSDKDGKVVLTLDTREKADAEELSIEVNAANYRTESLKITAGSKEITAVSLVSDRKDVFVSKRSGKYDVYSIDVDGKNEKKIVSGTGLERDDITLVPLQNSDMVAFIASRENTKNADGYLLSTLYFIDIKSGTLTKIDQSEMIRPIGWSASQRLVYVKVAAGASGANPKRHRIMSVSVKNTSDNKEIAAANYFNDVLMVNDRIVYAPSNAYNTGAKLGAYSVASDATGSVTLLDKEVYNILRTDYETLTLSVEGGSYTYKLGASSAAPATSSTTTNRLYIDNSNAKQSVWVDSRDGKNLLLAYDKSAKKDTTLLTKTGVKYPVYWLSDTVLVFRVNDGRETADYAVSTLGGDAKKIQDVSDAGGVRRWYYY